MSHGGESEVHYAAGGTQPAGKRDHPRGGLVSSLACRQRGCIARNTYSGETPEQAHLPAPHAPCGPRDGCSRSSTVARRQGEVNSGCGLRHRKAARPSKRQAVQQSRAAERRPLPAAAHTRGSPPPLQTHPRAVKVDHRVDAQEVHAAPDQVGGHQHPGVAHPAGGLVGAGQGRDRLDTTFGCGQAGAISQAQHVKAQRTSKLTGCSSCRPHLKLSTAACRAAVLWSAWMLSTRTPSNRSSLRASMQGRRTSGCINMMRQHAAHPQQRLRLWLEAMLLERRCNPRLPASGPTTDQCGSSGCSWVVATQTQHHPASPSINQRLQP